MDIPKLYWAIFSFSLISIPAFSQSNVINIQAEVSVQFSPENTVSYVERGELKKKVKNLISIEFEKIRDTKIYFEDLEQVKHLHGLDFTVVKLLDNPTYLLYSVYLPAVQTPMKNNVWRYRGSVVVSDHNIESLIKNYVDRLNLTLLEYLHDSADK